MAIRFYPGWNFSEIGRFEFQITDSGGTSTIAYSSGKFAHKNIAELGGRYAQYPDFKHDNTGSNGLQDKLNADNTLNGTYTIKLLNPYTYRIICDESFIVETGTNNVGARILGLSGSLPLSSSQDAGEPDHYIDSPHQPYFALTGAMGAKSAITGEFEPEEAAGELALTADGETQGIAPLSGAGVFEDFMVPFEGKVATFKKDRTLNTPWTWQHFFEHTRTIHPFMMEDDLQRTVYSNRLGGAHFEPEIETEDDDNMWNIRFECFVKGHLSGTA